MLWPNYQKQRKQRNEMKPGEIKSLRKCYCSFVTPECKGSRMDGRRWWKMALQTARESLIEREGRSVLLRAHSFKGFGCFTKLFKFHYILRTKSTSLSCLGSAELHCIEETEEWNDSQGNKVIMIKIIAPSWVWSAREVQYWLQI